MALNKEKVILTKELVLERVTPLEIFEAFMPHKFDLNGITRSPFRRDTNPSFSIRRKNGVTTFIDYGNGDRGDCFNFVSKISNAISFPEILENIDFRMGLNITKGVPKAVSVRKLEMEPDEVEEEKLFQVELKRFTPEELDWWGTFGLDINDLKKQDDVKVYSIQKLWINKELKFINYGELCFGYHFTAIDKWKIYFPLADKSKGEFKWLSNVPLQTMYGMNNIRNCKKAIITKSVKDLMVL